MNSESQRGFTLIEVVVALAIVIIAFMAMYGSMMQSVAATTLMQEKTIATWIAFDRITELRINNEFPEDDESTDEIEMAGTEWVYTTRFIPTEGAEDILRVIVKVAPVEEPDNILGIASGALIRFKPGANNNPQQGPGGQGLDNPEGIFQ
jgi:general secretion pathway protein I